MSQARRRPMAWSSTSSTRTPWGRPWMESGHRAVARTGPSASACSTGRRTAKQLPKPG